jgi:hypothetical protein
MREGEGVDAAHWKSLDVGPKASLRIDAPIITVDRIDQNLL